MFVHDSPFVNMRSFQVCDEPVHFHVQYWQQSR